MIDYKAKRSAAALRKSNRAEKARTLWVDKIRFTKPKKIKSLIKRGPLKKAIVRLLGLLDRKKNGNSCRLGGWCPDFRKIGEHAGTLSYHLVPQQRGDAARFVPDNVIWACRAANYGEVMNRSLYRDKHILSFGKERIERLEAIARETRQYKMSELLELRATLRAELESEALKPIR